MIHWCSNIIYYFEMKFKTCSADILCSLLPNLNKIDTLDIRKVYEFQFFCVFKVLQCLKNSKVTRRFNNVIELGNFLYNSRFLFFLFMSNGNLCQFITAVHSTRTFVPLFFVLKPISIGKNVKSEY